MLKPVNKEENPGLAKLPEKVRNRMGYAKKGKMAKAKKGMSVKGDDARDIRKVEEKIGASRSSKREKKIMKAKTGKMNKASLGLGVLATKKGRKAAKKFLSAKTQMSPSLNYLGRDMGGSVKSTRGYGAARTSGMGLEDEQLPPGKSLDYYKDLM